jgi:hypothetical protein
MGWNQGADCALPGRRGVPGFHCQVIEHAPSGFFRKVLAYCGHETAIASAQARQSGVGV